MSVDCLIVSIGLIVRLVAVSTFISLGHILSLVTMSQLMGLLIIINVNVNASVIVNIIVIVINVPIIIAADNADDHNATNTLYYCVNVNIH